MDAPVIFLTHTPAMRRNYYGEQALAGLRQLGTVRLHKGDAPLDAAQLVAGSVKNLGQRACLSWADSPG